MLETWHSGGLYNARRMHCWGLILTDSHPIRGCSGWAEGLPPRGGRWGWLPLEVGERGTCGCRGHHRTCCLSQERKENQAPLICSPGMNDLDKIWGQQRVSWLMGGFVKRLVRLTAQSPDQRWSFQNDWEVALCDRWPWTSLTSPLDCIASLKQQPWCHLCDPCGWATVWCVPSPHTAASAG